MALTNISTNNDGAYRRDTLYEASITIHERNRAVFLFRTSLKVVKRCILSYVCYRQGYVNKAL